MELLDGIFSRDLGIFIKNSNTLVLADFHIGYEEALNKQGILIPRFSFQDMLKRLTPILKKKFSTIIINGDLKHEFGTISKQEWSESKRLLAMLKMACEKLILIKGNHDTMLEAIGHSCEILECVKQGNILITHGDKLPKTLSGIETIIIAHEHPAIILKDKIRKEKFKCFLVGKFKNKNLIVQPSFNSISQGTDVAHSKLISPFLAQDIMNFKVFIVGDKVYNFGPLQELI